MPDTGVVATPAKNMSNKWKEKKIPINSGKTIQGMFKSTGLAAYLPQSLFKYLAQGTCVASTLDMAGYLLS